MRVDYDIMVLDPEDDVENMCYHLASVKNHPAGGNVFVLSSGIGVPNVINYEGWHEEPLQRLETIAKYHGHKAAIRYCSFSPSNNQLLSCCADQSMRVWDSKACTSKFVLAGHSDLVSSGVWLNETTVVNVYGLEVLLQLLYRFV